MQFSVILRNSASAAARWALLLGFKCRVLRTEESNEVPKATKLVSDPVEIQTQVRFIFSTI